MSKYADSSSLVSIYIPDQHTAEMERRLLSRPLVWLTPLHLAEFAHAVEQHVFRKAASREDADRFLQIFQHDRERALWKEAPLPERAFELCADLAQRYAAQVGTRTLDSLHVACALELKAEEFWTFDERQMRLARLVGLPAK